MDHTGAGQPARKLRTLARSARAKTAPALFGLERRLGLIQCGAETTLKSVFAVRTIVEHRICVGDNAN